MWERKYRDKFVFAFFFLGLAEMICSATTIVPATNMPRILPRWVEIMFMSGILYYGWMLAEFTNMLTDAAKRGSRVCRSVSVWYGWMVLLTLLFGLLRVWITYWLLRCGWQWAWLTLTGSAALWIWMLWNRRRSVVQSAFPTVPD